LDLPAVWNLRGYWGVHYIKVRGVVRAMVEAVGQCKGNGHVKKRVAKLKVGGRRPLFAKSQALCISNTFIPMGG